MSTRHFVLALCASVAFGAPAQAAIIDITADISQFQYHLIDLDPNDGIVPAITFTGTTAFAASHIGSFSTGADYRSIDTVGTTELSTPIAQSWASVAPTAISARVSLDEGAGYGQWSDADSTYTYAFTLTPNTGLAVSALGAVSMKKPVGEASIGFIQLSGQLHSEAPSVVESSWFSSNYRITTGTGQLESAHIGLSGYLYTDHQARNGMLKLSAITDALVASPVPEPGTWAMLLAGAALIGARACKRARAAQDIRVQP